MQRPVQAVEDQVRAWRDSPAAALAGLHSCARVFLRRATLADETLSALAPLPPTPGGPEPPPETLRRWKRSGCVLFWAAAALLCGAALAAGYFLAFTG